MWRWGFEWRLSGVNQVDPPAKPGVEGAGDHSYVVGGLGGCFAFWRVVFCVAMPFAFGRGSDITNAHEKGVCACCGR